MVTFPEGYEDLYAQGSGGGDWAAPQPPCPCCTGYGVDGCVGPRDLPPDWRTTEPFAEAACSREGCECWGGPDRECEDCWLDGK